MKSKLFVVIMLLLTSLSNLFAVQKYKKTTDKNFLWKIKGKSNYVYLLGSVHMLPKSIYPLHQSIENAYSESGIIVVEADISNINAGVIQQKIQQRGFYDFGKSLKDELEPKLYQKLVDHLAKEPLLGIEQISRMKPWLAAMTLVQVSVMKMGMQSNSGIDLHFLNKAHKDGKKILELESGDFQIDLLSRMKPKLQALFLESSLEDLTNEKDKLEKTIQFWLDGDTEGINKTIVEESFKDQEMRPLHKKLFEDRNNGMTQKVLRYLQDKTGRNYLVIAGAAHLVGKTGIIEQLKAKGYKLRQL